MSEIDKLKKEIMQKIGLSTREEAIAKGISDLSDEDKLEYFSNLAPIEDDQIALMTVIAQRYNIPWLEVLIRKKLKLRTSVLGWRANQIVAVATEKAKAERTNILAKLFQKREKKRWEVESFE